MSLIEKIDAEIERLHEEQRSMRSGVDAERVWLKIDEAEKIKRIILSEQKEPCVTDTNVGKIITIGEKIRESNESLANLILNYGSVCDYCSIKNNASKCRNTGCAKAVIDYLNQPYTE